MRIGEITISAEYQMNEQNQNLPIFGIKLWFSKLKKKNPKFSLLTNSKKNNQFWNCSISKISKFFKFDNL